MTTSETESETLPPGLYYIGDLMYLSLSEEEFEKSMDEIGVFTNEKGQKCAVFRTMAGDGVYLDNDGHSYSVDSGMIGAYPINSLEEAHSLGKGVEFLEEVRAGYDEETSIISFGDIHIHTDPFDEVNDPHVEKTYVGGYKDGMPHGQGTYTYADGSTYVGKFRDGKFHGQGTFTHADGDKYLGEFKDGKFPDQGTITTPAGRKYVGELKDGAPHGHGTDTFPRGKKYVGEFKDGEWWDGTEYDREGNALRTYSKGKRQRMRKLL